MFYAFIKLELAYSIVKIKKKDHFYSFLDLYELTRRVKMIMESEI